MATADAACELRVVDQVTKRHIHRGFVRARTRDMPADAKQFRTAILLRSNLREPLWTVLDDQRHVTERLDVVDSGRTAPQPFHCWKRRLDAWLRALAFERFDER